MRLKVVLVCIDVLENFTMAQVTMYTTPTCVYCAMAKKFFEERKIQYVVKDVASDEAAREEMLQKSHQMGVPVIDIDGTIIVGFNKPRLIEVLGSKNN